MPLSVSICRCFCSCIIVVPIAITSSLKFPPFIDVTYFLVRFNLSKITSLPKFDGYTLKTAPKHIHLYFKVPESLNFTSPSPIPSVLMPTRLSKIVILTKFSNHGLGRLMFSSKVAGVRTPQFNPIFEKISKTCRS